MIPFKSVSEVIHWWRCTCVHQSVSVLVDNTDIGYGIQKRTICYDRYIGWNVGFPNA